MPLHAEQFFTRQLALTDGTVVADTYYATPQPGSPLRLRIGFSRTIRLDEYDGLRLQILHTGQGGVLDTAVLTFADHDTFHSRDTAIGRAPGHDGYARMRDWHQRDEPPWQGAATTKLRRAIDQYTRLWFPQPTTRARTSTPPVQRTLSGRPPAPEPNGFWLTDPDFRTRLQSATHLLLDLLADCLGDGISLLPALDGARYHGSELLGIPTEFGVLVEAETAAEIVGIGSGSPHDPAVARGLVLLDQRPIEEQQRAVQAALRRSAGTTTSHQRHAPAPVPQSPAHRTR
ncbi:hypothetical protein E4N62_12600 [Streptomyces sp. MNU76]|uniref:hypothetical protein n=1 Tax=Streptomyces sp. MNU76 TaxID=2560026 RepID=UPI001E46B5C6|nr:hypothetical protein [Streptomyces sp. MNU76]MCC9706022.1 hypothetical protein [Streptomyces sp. MNU76]